MSQATAMPRSCLENMVLAAERTNIAFFLTPKREVVWVSASGTVEQALERMKPNGYSAVPILDDDGGFVGTLSTSDLMWHLMQAGEAWRESARATPLLCVRRALDDSSMHIDGDLGQLIARVATQGFVSVVDDRGAFIGIVRRRPIIEHLACLAGLAGCLVDQRAPHRTAPKVVARRGPHS